MRFNFEFSLWARRLLMLLIGVAVTEFGSQLYVALDIGCDPFMVLVQGIAFCTGLSYGQASTAIMLVCLAVIFFAARHHMRPGTIFCMFCLGPIVDFYAWLFRHIIPTERPVWLTLVLVVVGCIIVSIGVGISIRSQAGACANDLIPVVLEEKTRMQLRTARMLMDGSCIAVGFLLGGVVGFGTLIALTLFGPGLQFFLPIANRLFGWLRISPEGKPG